MKEQFQAILDKATDSLEAAKLLADQGILISQPREPIMLCFTLLRRCYWHEDYLSQATQLS